MKVNLDYIDLRCKGVMKCSSRSHPNNTDYTLGFPFNYDFVLYVHRLTLYAYITCQLNSKHPSCYWYFEGKTRD